MAYWDGERWLDDSAMLPKQSSRSSAGRGSTAIFVGLLTALLAMSLVVAPVFAAKGGHKGNGPAPKTNGACAVTPDPATVGGTYTVDGWGLPADQFVSVVVQDSHGSMSWFAQTDSDGLVSVSSWASWAGTSNVSVSQTRHHKATVLASCSFDVQ